MNSKQKDIKVQKNQKEKGPDPFQQLAFLINSPYKSQNMFSKIGRDLSNRFLNSSISINTPGTNICTPQIRPTDNFKKKRILKKRIPFRCQFPSVGHYSVKYDHIDANVFKPFFKHEQKFKSPLQAIQNIEQNSMKLRKSQSQSIKPRAVKGHVDFQKKTNRLQAINQTRYCFNNPHQARFLSYKQPTNFSKFHEIKSPDFHKNIARFKNCKSEQTTFYYNPNFQFTKKTLKKGTPKFQLVTGREKPPKTPTQLQYYEYQKNKFHSSVYDKQRTYKSKKDKIFETSSSSKTHGLEPAAIYAATPRQSNCNFHNK